MNLDIARSNIRKYIYCDHYFIYSGSRGFIEKFHGRIIKMFSHCFIIETTDFKIKCYSYSDFIVKGLLIY